MRWSWISFPHHNNLAFPRGPHDTPHVTRESRTVANLELHIGRPGASWLPPNDQKWSDVRWVSGWGELAAHWHRGRKFSLSPPFPAPKLAVKDSSCPVLSSSQSLPPSPLQSLHCSSDVLLSCPGTKVSADRKLFTFFFTELIFCHFIMLKWLSKGHDKASRTGAREGQEHIAPGKGKWKRKEFSSLYLYIIYI